MTQYTILSEGSSQQLRVLPPPESSNLCPKGAEENKDEEEEDVVYTAAAKDMDNLYSSLAEPDLRDLPFFAYQISQGMVCKSNQQFCTTIICIITADCVDSPLIP